MSDWALDSAKLEIARLRQVLADACIDPGEEPDTSPSRREILIWAAPRGIFLLAMVAFYAFYVIPRLP